MIRAYSELYVEDAMQTLAETFDYVRGGRQADMLLRDFIVSGVAEQFGRGNPYYVNMPSQVLFEEITRECPPRKRAQFEKSPEYWCGFVLAYYQWFTGLGFEQIGRRLPPSRILEMYHPLHEAEVDKFVDVANSVVFHKETNLARYRKDANLSQSDLSRLCGVSLRSIQLYEQRRLDINMAPAIKLLRMSRVLGCEMEDLLERKS